MKGIIESIFSDNPELPHKIYTYCKSIPEYSKAERDYEAMLESLKAQLGFNRMAQIEDRFLRYMAWSVQAYYLFGLGLRQEVLWALGKE